MNNVISVHFKKILVDEIFYPQSKSDFKQCIQTVLDDDDYVLFLEALDDYQAFEKLDEDLQKLVTSYFTYD